MEQEVFGRDAGESYQSFQCALIAPALSLECDSLCVENLYAAADVDAVVFQDFELERAAVDDEDALR